MFVWLKDFNILLQIYRYKIKPTLFFNCVVITIWLLHNYLRCFLCSTNCEIKIDFSALSLSFKLPKCPLTFANVGVIWWNNAWFYKTILETIRNSEIRWNEYITGKDKNLGCVKHLNNHFDHEFRWFVLSRAYKNCLKRKILETYYIKTCQPSLSNQINSDVWTFLEMVSHRIARFYPSCIYFNCFLTSKSFLYIWWRFLQFKLF